MLPGINFLHYLSLGRWAIRCASRSINGFTVGTFSQPLLHALAHDFLTSALGTPLEWPEAKQAASQVRAWGIEVAFTVLHLLTAGLTFLASNFLQHGGEQRAKKEMLCFGATRSV